MTRDDVAPTREDAAPTRDDVASMVSSGGCEDFARTGETFESPVSDGRRFHSIGDQGVTPGDASASPGAQLISERLVIRLKKTGEKQKKKKRVDEGRTGRNGTGREDERGRVQSARGWCVRWGGGRGGQRGGRRAHGDGTVKGETRDRVQNKVYEKMVKRGMQKKAGGRRRMV